MSSTEVSPTAELNELEQAILHIFFTQCTKKNSTTMNLNQIIPDNLWYNHRDVNLDDPSAINAAVYSLAGRELLKRTDDETVFELAGHAEDENYLRIRGLEAAAVLRWVDSTNIALKTLMFGEASLILSGIPGSLFDLYNLVTAAQYQILVNTLSKVIENTPEGVTPVIEEFACGGFGTSTALAANPEFAEARYTGIDQADFLIEHNRTKHTDPRFNFIASDERKYVETHSESTPEKQISFFFMLDSGYFMSQASLLLLLVNVVSRLRPCGSVFISQGQKTEIMPKDGESTELPIEHPSSKLNLIYQHFKNDPSVTVDLHTSDYWKFWNKTAEDLKISGFSIEEKLSSDDPGVQDMYSEAKGAIAKQREHPGALSGRYCLVLTKNPTTKDSTAESGTGAGAAAAEM